MRVTNEMMHNAFRAMCDAAKPLGFDVDSFELYYGNESTGQAWNIISTTGAMCPIGNLTTSRRIAYEKITSVTNALLSVRTIQSAIHRQEGNGK